ncbi:predicted protein [Naegleria gruberi]|uniref:Predicted protein n=1 Tax=Naegleria gruberi TaxID=5762 RepID=D2VB09_NAEGR|nr:uncharacterized protein NAEGRDRAFT_66047 [Naegleria gruberi]EFC46176.1 predicted protein [Naegleria gruberi]|eukprot:XP_002678920.1 predicted protein [Naegleria gruberi strain NEG-M]
MMKLNYSLCTFFIILAIISFLHAKQPLEKPTTFAYSIYYHDNSCNQQSISAIEIYPVYGQNGTCFQNFESSSHFKYMKAVCGKDSATIYTYCVDSNCQYCDAVYDWKFHKNECGMQNVGCGNIPQLVVPLLYTYSFEYIDAENSCSGNLVSIAGEDVNYCEQVTGKEFERVSCNQTTWTRSYYLKDESCSANSFTYSLNGRTNVCKDHSMLTCGKVLQ